LIQKSQFLLKIWILPFEKGAVLPVAVPLELAALLQSAVGLLNNVQGCGLLPPTYQDSNYPF